MEYSSEQIVGMCEAYNMYNILPKEAQEKIPKEFVEKIKKYGDLNLGYPINTPYSLKSKEISEEGLKLMAYMCLFIK